MAAKLSFIDLGGRFKVQYRNTTGVLRSSPEDIYRGFYDPIFAEDLRWYIEDYLAIPYGAYRDRAKETEASLKESGKRLFENAFSNAGSRELYDRARAEGLNQCDFEIISSSAEVLSIPWEMMYDQSAMSMSLFFSTQFIGHSNYIERGIKLQSRMTNSEFFGYCPKRR